MESRFFVERQYFDTSFSMKTESLDVSMCVPREILGLMGKCSIYSLIQDLTVHLQSDIRYSKFYEEPSSQSREMKELELVAYGIVRDRFVNPFRPLKDCFKVFVEPKYRPRWIGESPTSHRGWKNYLSSEEFSSPPVDFFIFFSTNAFHFGSAIYSIKE